MTKAKNIKRLQNLIWILVYGGLLTFILGLFTQRNDAALGEVLSYLGGAVAVIGFALIYVRSRLKVTPD
jgi:hypothetical protein